MSLLQEFIDISHTIKAGFLSLEEKKWDKMSKVYLLKRKQEVLCCMYFFKKEYEMLPMFPWELSPEIMLSMCW